jgi:hypothetical protein
MHGTTRKRESLDLHLTDNGSHVPIAGNGRSGADRDGDAKGQCGFCRSHAEEVMHSDYQFKDARHKRRKIHAIGALRRRRFLSLYTA